MTAADHRDTTGDPAVRQDRRDSSAGEVLRAMSRLGFTCRTLPEAGPARIEGPLQRASAMLGTPCPPDRRDRREPNRAVRALPARAGRVLTACRAALGAAVGQWSE
ncbi:SCO5918 family protein [Streptomyces sp. Li-HN-5-11]|nr:SCO5918 family protein [Streptomyces sp. Li-HN-5-11]WNM36491.1 SCO5918 family protein [Streptomyces sp. Li-HN-5-11]